MKRISLLLIPVLILFVAKPNAPAQGTAFTYQGRLNDGGGAANGAYDLRFTIYDAGATGNFIGGPVTNAATAVSNGLFTVTLDFGAGVFTGANRWLEISVRTNGSPNDFTAISPRQAITAAPYAIFSAASGSLSNGIIQNPMFLGTLGITPLELFAGNQRALRLEPNTNGAPNVIGGSLVNQIDAGMYGSTIAGGGVADYFGYTFSNRVANHFVSIGGGAGNLAEGFGSTISGGLLNRVQGYSALVGGGYGNTVQDASYSAISAGEANTVEVNAQHSYIGGGSGNVIQPDAFYASILGGAGNTNGASNASLGGGLNNWIEPSADWSVIGGGWYNYIQGGADQSVVAGGNANKILAGARESFVGGGFNNVIQTNSAGSFIGAGFGNSVGINSTASTIGGGGGNAISNSAPNATIAGGGANKVGVAYATVGGGYQNFASGNFNGAGDSATVAGGYQNAAVGNNAVVAGGYANHARGDNSSILGGWLHTNLTGFGVIGGGQQELIEPFSRFSVIAGGDNNTIHSNSTHGVIAGGQFNSIGTNALYATVAGGLSNSASGTSSFAAGRRAKANHQGAFVWADSTDADFSSTASNQFNIRAMGGLRLETSSGAATLNGQPILSGTVPAGALSGTYSNAITLNNSANTFSGNGAGLSNVNASTLNGLASSNFWQLNGNSVQNGQFLGSTNNQALELRVSALRALRLEPNTNGAANVIAGSPRNFVDPNIVGATIGGGGAISRSGASYTNHVTGDFGTVAGGAGNTSGRFSTASGLGASADGVGAVAMGWSVTANGDFGPVALGYACYASGVAAKAIGYFAEATANYSTAMGSYSRARHPGSFVWADTQSPFFDSITNDQFSIRAQNGVRLNTDTSLFWGSGAKLWPDQGGTIELGDSKLANCIPYVDFHYGVSADQDYNVRLINDANGQLSLIGNLAFGAQTRQMLNLYSSAYGIGVQPYRLYFRTDGPGGFAWFAGGTHSDSTDNAGAGGNEMMRLDATGLRVNGTFVSASDRNVKAGFESVDPKSVLQKVAALAITRWHYTNDPGTPHIGAVAQDFHAAFNVGIDDKHIATVDADGVALAAIQGLNQKLEALEEQVRRKDAENADLKRRLEAIEKVIQKND